MLLTLSKERCNMQHSCRAEGNSRYHQSYKILQKKELVDKTFYFQIEAPFLARKIQAGQFIIIRPNAKSERIPLSVCGWNREKGYIEIIIMAAGRTSQEATLKEKGQCFQDVVGPLGQHSHIQKQNGVCVVIGGGYGSGAVLPTARELKAAGNKVYGIAGARSADLLLLRSQIQETCDQTFFTTNDGSLGIQGFVTDALKEILQKEKVSYVLAIGPVPMMKAVGEMTRASNIETWVSLNAIMVDGTGMCGACRVSVGGKTKFACYHGPDFLAHEVNFDELTARQKMFMFQEKEALAAQ